jgi:hypothetical protein
MLDGSEDRRDVPRRGIKSENKRERSELTKEQWLLPSARKAPKRTIYMNMKFDKVI